MKSLGHNKPLATVTKSALFNPIYWFNAVQLADVFPTCLKVVVGGLKPFNIYLAFSMLWVISRAVGLFWDLAMMLSVVCRIS